MKVKYLATFAIISLLSVGTMVPTILLGTTTAVANPYAAKVSSADSVGGPLARKLQGKPVVVEIHASWCPACKNIAPTLSQLRQQYAGKVHFVKLDVSTKSTTSQSESMAKQLGLSKFFADNKNQTGLVTIINPSTGNILAQYRNNSSKADYTAVLNSEIAKR